MQNGKMKYQPVLDRVYKLANTPSTNGWPRGSARPVVRPAPWFGPVVRPRGSAPWFAGPVVRRRGSPWFVRAPWFVGPVVRRGSALSDLSQVGFLF